MTCGQDGCPLKKEKNKMQAFLEHTYFGNSILGYFTALAIFIGGISVVKVFTMIILYRLKKWSEKTDTPLDDFLIKGIEKSVIPILYFGAFYLAVKSLALSVKVENIVQVASMFLLTFFAVRFISSTIVFTLRYFVQKQERGDEKVRQMRGLTVLITVLVWVVGIVFLMDNWWV